MEHYQTIRERFNPLKREGHKPVDDSQYFGACVKIFEEYCSSEGDFLEGEDYFFYKKFVSLKDRKQSAIWGGLSRQEILRAFATVSTAVAAARRTKWSKPVVMVTSCFTQGFSGNSHSRLIVVSKGSSGFKLIVYDPLERENITVGSSTRSIAQLMKIKQADFVCGNQELQDRDCVENCMSKALDLLFSEAELTITRVFDFKAKDWTTE